MLKKNHLKMLLVLFAHAGIHNTVQSAEMNENSTDYEITQSPIQQTEDLTSLPHEESEECMESPALPSTKESHSKTTPTKTSSATKLSCFNFEGASVLPTFINENGKKYLILSREKGGKDKGTYDDFGGARDTHRSKKEHHPKVTASREFFEEAILKHSINLSLEQTQKFIDIDSGHTEYVIAHEGYVTYITDFSTYATTFFNRFYHAFEKTTSHHSKEKDRIAIIEWESLKNSINKSKYNSGINVQAEVLNPANNKWNTEKITLRPFFAKKLRSFWMDKPYQHGLNRKIRFY